MPINLSPSQGIFSTPHVDLGSRRRSIQRLLWPLKSATGDHFHTQPASLPPGPSPRFPTPPRFPFLPEGICSGLPPIPRPQAVTSLYLVSCVQKLPSARHLPGRSDSGAPRVNYLKRESILFTVKCGFLGPARVLGAGAELVGRGLFFC